MSDVSLDKNLELLVSFEKAGPGAAVSDACMQEIVDRLRVAVRSESVVSGEVKIAGDAENILTQNGDGELRVQQSTMYSESQDVAVPDAVEAGGDSYLVPVTRFRVTAVIMSSSDVIAIPNAGQTFEDPDYVYPTSLQVLVDNLNAEDAPFTWAIQGGVLVVTSDLGLGIEAILEGGETETDTIKKITAEQIEEATPGDVELTFTEARSVKGIDYASQFLILPVATPGDGFDRMFITSISSTQVKVKVTKVSKVLRATLNVFTPAQREDSSEF
jgi:hypothetical protein